MSIIGLTIKLTGSTSIMKNLILIILIIFSINTFAENTTKDTVKAENNPIPKAKVYTSQHQIKLSGRSIKYTATAGTMLMKNKKGEPIALFGFTAYIKNKVDQRKRPIIFAYNGGPGAASLWLNMGALGPQRVIIKDAGFTHNGPFKRVSNDYSIIDKADLVMIDPVGTGFSKVIGKGKGKDFWGVDQDINSVANFIVKYVSENKRWSSPKYILGESYGGMRSAGLSYNLLTKHNLALNGVILVSPFLDFTTGSDDTGEDLPHVLYLPTFAATAYYHNALPKQPKNRDAFLAKVEAFATGDYASALMQGASISEAFRDQVLTKLHQYTGISKAYWKRANLRIGHQQFTKELLRKRGETTGRFDSRFQGQSVDLNGENMNYDPQDLSISPAFVATFMDYYASDLKVPPTQKYIVGANIEGQWDWRHTPPNSYGSKIPVPFTTIDLAYAMTMNPHMKVLFQMGYYDLATPFFATKYMINHLKISPKIRKNISTAYYDAGHMMYVHQPSLKKFKTVISKFIQQSH